jgi:ribonuclease P protein component
MLNSLHRFHGLNSLNATYKRGEVVRGPILSLRYAPNTRRTKYRAAVVVSKKVDKSAVVRNRIRRRVYEIVRTQLGDTAPAYDLIFSVFSNQVATITATELQSQIASLVKRAGVTGAKPPEHGIVEQKKIRESKD